MNSEKCIYFIFQSSSLNMIKANDLSQVEQTEANDLCFAFWKFTLPMGFPISMREDAYSEDIPQKATTKVLQCTFSRAGVTVNSNFSKGGCTYSSISKSSSSSANIYQKIIKLKLVYIQTQPKYIFYIQMNKFQSLEFNELEIIQTLAETHNGTTKIYLCKHESKLQVCKAIQKLSVANDSKAIEHLKNQKEALQHFTRLKFPCISHFFGTFQDEQCLYIMMELVHGLPLHKILQMMGPLSDRIVKIICYQIGDIMKRFHAEGFIYRDIKSSNFMMDMKGRIKMIDLGKAKRINKQRAYTICGTTHSMPPEVYLKKGYSYQFDYYSFGVLIYELMKGKAPFGYGGSNKTILQDIQRGISMEMLLQIKNQQARDLISKLMRKQPENRLGKLRGFDEILQHPFFLQESQYALEILRGSSQLSQYDEQFTQLISEIEDLGIDPQKYNEIDQNDPFYKFFELKCE